MQQKLSVFLAAVASIAVLEVNPQPATAASISFQAALNAANRQPLTNGVYNLTFQFWNSPTATAATNQVGSSIMVSNVMVNAGIASTPFSVDPAWFNGQMLYLGISINGTAELAPRVLVTAVPYALKAATAGDENENLLLNGYVEANGGFYSPGPTDSGFSYEGEFREGTFANWGGLGVSADCYRLLGSGSRYAGYGMARGVNIESPFVWMYQKPGNGFQILSVGYGETVPQVGRTLFEVYYDGTTEIHGNTTVFGTTSTRVLQITGGADLAEQITVDSPKEPGLNVQPGMVVSIDPSSNRKFKLSDEPYDRKRVGIISGGNGVRPGLVLKDDGNAAVAGDQPIALTGQVWCRADATFGPITPGDLLTTSSTPGHAMKVSDDAKARFTVLGQALTGLNQGRGWVQVLVGKQ